MMTDYSDDFEKLWKSYPKRSGKKIKKFPAFQKWQKLDSGQKSVLKANVDKRNRQQTWGKYIRDLVTYINQRGWEDEVTDGSFIKQQVYLPIDAGLELTPWDSCLNRMLLKYMRTAGGLNDFKKAVQIKIEVLEEISIAMNEELKSGTVIGECFVIITDLFLTRLDAGLGLTLKGRVLT